MIDNGAVISDLLRHKRIAITGTTGFLGTALVERLLRSVPDCELVLLLRPGRMRTVEQRAQREIFRNNAFDRLRQELGGAAFDEMVAQRVTIIEGDIGSDGLGLNEFGRQELSQCDVVIHSAATVSFDSPLDSAVEINLLGPTRIAQTLHELEVSPHLIAVSTCYVAGNHRGEAHEVAVDDSPFFVDIPWRREVDAARRTRSDLEAQSRTPSRLAGFQDDAKRELGAAGIPLLAAKAEQYRTRWVNDEMVEAGKSRAQMLGFPDVYSYTKALGERALAETKGDLQTTVVRPSIIESAVAEPYPGWIRGFRMAEPVIISYAQGLLTQFPGVPEGIVDVIPVDLVVAAIVAVAALPPAETPDVVQVASGAANPLHYRKLVSLIESYFSKYPIYDSLGQPIGVPDWKFPRRGKVEGQLAKAKVSLDKADKFIHSLPLRGTQTRWSAKIEDKRADVERALTYVDLYGAYAQCEAIYTIDKLLSVWDSLDRSDQETFMFDPRLVDWDAYATGTHLPSIVEHARVRTSPTEKSGPSRNERLRRQVLSPDRHMAAFDLENTLIASNVVTSYAWLATRRLPNEDKARLAANLIAEAPRLLSLDKADRTDFLRYFYRRYKGAPVEQLAEDSLDMMSALILAKSFPAAIRRVRKHRELGHRTVLITGALDFVVEPLRPLFDDIVAAEMTIKGGRYTGELVRVPPTGEARAQAMVEYAAREGLELDESVAYADSTSDLPMLEAVGFPVAVNPETRLASLARKRGWLVENFPKGAKGVHPVLPIAPTRVGSE